MTEIQKKEKGFFTIISLLYILMAITSVSPNQERLIEFSTITFAETQQISKILSFEKIIENNLNNYIEDPLILKYKVNTEIISFFKDKENQLFIYNIIDNTQEEICFQKLQEITQVIVYKPSEHVVIKRYVITNGLEKNKYILVPTENINYKTHYLFPKEYVKEVVVYKP